MGINIDPRLEDAKDVVKKSKKVLFFQTVRKIQ
jgi:hypothetical protein